MINFNTISFKIFSILNGSGYEMQLLGADGKETVDPSAARRFHIDSPDTIVTLDDAGSNIIINKASDVSIDVYERMIKNLKNIANHYALGFVIHDAGKNVMPKNDSLSGVTESKMYGTKKTSYQMIGEVKLIVKHSDAVSENTRGARSKLIHSIFLEKKGKKIKFPYRNLKGARAMAMHMGYGGDIGDSIGESICTNVENLIKLREFMRYVRSNKLINEDTDDIVILVKDSIKNINETLHKVGQKTTYTTATKSLLPPTNSHGDNIDSLRDKFTVKHFDNKFENILPLIGNRIKENDMNMMKLEQASSRPIKISGIKPLEENILQYQKQSSKIGNRLMAMSLVILENDELASFVRNVGMKYIAEESISPFEKKIVANVLKNGYVYKAGTEKKCAVKESINKFDESISKYGYSGLLESLEEEQLDEGWLDKILSFFGKEDNLEKIAKEVADTGERLKEIEDHLKKMGLMEYASDAEHTALVTMFREAVQRYEAARRGLGLVNKLKGIESKKKNASRVMTNLNKLRNLVGRMNRELRAGMQISRN